MQRPSASAYLLGSTSVVELADEPEDPVIFTAANGDRGGHLAGVCELGEGSYYVVADTLCNSFCVHIESTAALSLGVQGTCHPKK